MARDDAGWVRRLEKVEEAIGVLGDLNAEAARWIVWLLQSIESIDTGGGLIDNPPPPVCPSYRLGCLVTVTCGHLTGYIPTYEATLTDADDVEIDAWTAVPGTGYRVVTVAGPGRYTLTVEVDIDGRGPSTFSSTLLLLASQCFAYLAVETCYATAIRARVLGCAGRPLQGATVSWTGDQVGSEETDADGVVLVPYTGAADRPDLTFVISHPGMATHTTAADPFSLCCTAVPPNNLAEGPAISGGVQLQPDAAHVCGCDPTCAKPVPRQLVATTDKGATILTYGRRGSSWGWWGEIEWEELEAGGLVDFPKVGGGTISCCVKTTKTVSILVWLHCCASKLDGSPYLPDEARPYCLSYFIPGQCGGYTGYAECLTHEGVRTAPRLTGLYSVGLRSSPNTYSHSCGGTFNASFNFGGPYESPVPPELPTTVVLTELD